MARLFCKNLVLLIVLFLMASCATTPEIISEREKDVDFELNPYTVASVVIEAFDDDGYGIHIVLSDAGWNKMQDIIAGRPNKFLIKIEGRVVTQIIDLSGSGRAMWPRDTVWTGPAMDENGNYVEHDFYGFSKEEAEALIKGITQVGINR